MSIPVDRWSKAGAPDATQLRVQMESEGYAVSECMDAPGTVHPPHDHNEDQTIWVVSGSLQLRVGDHNYSLHAGDRDYLPAHTEHSAIAVGDEPVVYLIGAKT